MPKTWLLPILIILVCTAVTAVHFPALHAQAITFDDDQYLVSNPLVQNPSLYSAQRFLTEILNPSTVEGYYQPLTMISLMIDYGLGGDVKNLMPFHRTSFILHVANTALVIVLLYMLFGQPWIAAAAGLLFGLHPMTVDAIPWIGERKTLLAAFFSFWCLIFYLRYIKNSNRRTFYLSLLFYLLALMSKPTSIPLPVVMLLMDFWPLKRLKWQTVSEKIPFFILAGIFAVITVISQNYNESSALPGGISFLGVFLIICHNIIFYLYKIVWPVNISSWYSFPHPLAFSQPMVMAGVIGTVALIPILILSLRRTHAAFTGWLIFFIAIFPTMNVIQFTNVVAANKFAYLPSIGLLMALSALLIWLLKNNNRVKQIIASIIILALASGEAVATRGYIAYWQDSLSLARHMVALAPDAAMPMGEVANCLDNEGKTDEAVNWYLKALKIEPNLYITQYNLANAYKRQGNFASAIEHYQTAIKLKPDFVAAYNNLASIFRDQGKLNEAISLYIRALQITPDFVEIHYNCAIALIDASRFREAAEHLQTALRLRPGWPEAENQLSALLAAHPELKRP